MHGRDGTNLEFDSNRILNGISSKFKILEYEYSVASNAIRILNGVEMSCMDAASSCGQEHRSVPESSATWPYASIFLFTF